MLHIVNKSPFERNSLETCLSLAMDNSTILLIEDAVYAAMQGGKFSDKMASAAEQCSVYVLAPDLQARGMPDEKIISGIKTVDYSGFVDLVADNKNVQSWL